MEKLMQVYQVNLGERSYDIHIESGCLGHIGDKLTQLFSGAKRCLIASNNVVAPLYLNTVQQSLEEAGWLVHTHLFPDGEAFKNLEQWSQLLDSLMDAKLSRDEPMIALGGGVVGDMTGFAASAYRRGIPFVQIPTTLLAQVDSSVGGKTAVSHPHGKNMIGAFYQPKLVWIDTDVLQTLAANQLRAGLAEVLKYGAIWDKSFFSYVAEHASALHMLDTNVVSQVILASCRYKAEIVMQDETEQGARALLNLGHTFGHAIESMTHYTTYLHGEAVAIGMRMAARLSEQLGHASQGTEEAMLKALTALELPVDVPQFSARQWLDTMGHDKKNVGSLIRYILLRDIGDAFIADDVKHEDIQTLIQSFA